MFRRSLPSHFIKAMFLVGRSTRMRASMLILMLCLPVAAHAEQGLVELLRKQRSSFEVLEAAARRSRYVTVGEDHGIAESTAFVSKLFCQLAGTGHKTLVVEVGPAVAGQAAEWLRRPSPSKAIAEFDRTFPDSLAFYNWRDDAEALQQIAGCAGKGFEVWGVDQELMGASKFLLRQIEREKLSPAAKATLTGLQERELAAQQEAARTGDPTKHYMMTASDDELEAMRNQLDGHARALIDALHQSRDIYRKGISGAAYESNMDRALLMKRSLAAKLQADPARKLLIRVGASHAYKGMNHLGSRDLGNYLVERAEGDGQVSLHVLVVAAHGKQLRFAGTARPAAVAPIPLYTEGFKPFLDAVQGEAGTAIYDLRPLHANAQLLAAGRSGMEQALRGFDFVVVIPEASAAQPISTGNK